MTAANWISIAQIIVGAAVTLLIPVVGYIAWTLNDHRDRLTRVESRVANESGENARRFTGLENWMEKIDAKLDRIAERQP